jgi:hypothetical protein
MSTVQSEISKGIEYSFRESAFIKTANFVLAKELTSQIQFLAMVKSNDTGDIKLKMETKFIQIPTHQVSTKTSKEAENDMESCGLSLEDSILSVLKNETLYNAEKCLLKEYTEKSLKFPLNTSQRVLARIFPKMEFPTYISSWQEARKMVFMTRGFLSSNSRRGSGNFLVVPNEISSFIQDDPAFIFKTEPTPIAVNPVKEIGTWNGIRCFDSPYINGKILLGNTMRNEGAFFVYKESKIDKEKLDDHTTTILKTYFTPCITESNFYLTRSVKTGKAPLWRRILGV